MFEYSPVYFQIMLLCQWQYTWSFSNRSVLQNKKKNFEAIPTRKLQRVENQKVDVVQMKKHQGQSANICHCYHFSKIMWTLDFLFQIFIRYVAYFNSSHQLHGVFLAMVT